MRAHIRIWIYAMRRRNWSQRQRLALFVGANGACQACQIRLQPGQTWDLDHIIPIALGGADETQNLQVLCIPCHKDKTNKRDIPAIAKSVRLEAKHLGAKSPSRHPMPFGRQSIWKKKLDGTIVKRNS